MGAAIATILVGPWAAILVMTCVVSVQALIFQDGGLLALGANIFNMGIIGVTVSYFVYSTMRRLAGEKPWGIFAGGFLAAWLSIVVASLAVALELAISGTSPANIAVPAMAAVHALIGLGEALITVGVLAFIYSVRRDLLDTSAEPVKGRASLWGVGLIIAVGLAIASPLASVHPDGLEWVAERQGFLETAQSPIYEIVPDYVFPGISSEALATIIAGLIGVLIVFLIMLGVGYSRRKRSIES
jgi:cobalt/nickel transport system permease protein